MNKTTEAMAEMILEDGLKLTEIMDMTCNDLYVRGLVAAVYALAEKIAGLELNLADLRAGNI